MMERSSVPPRPALPVLSAQERARLGQLAWRGLRRTSSSSAVSGTQEGALARPSGVFVTVWLDGDLRGCLGSALPRMPLARAVVEHAHGAATRDPRFPAVAPEELERLEVDISVLGPMWPIPGPASDRARHVCVGEDGLYVTSGRHSGLLLPQVAPRFGWDATEFLEATCGKADLAAGAWRDSTVEVHAFRALGFPAPRPPEVPADGMGPAL